MNSQSFEAIARFVTNESGIRVGANKSYMVEDRLTPVLTSFGISSFEHLATQLLAAPDELRTAVLDAMATNESFFFRDQTPFDLFQRVMLPELVERKAQTNEKIRIWCAAAATGQEPYSLAMAALECEKQLAGVGVEIIGTDISASALNIANLGQYRDFEVQRGLSGIRRERFFDRNECSWAVKEEVRKLVRFEQRNLVHETSWATQFDVIFCRNVLIYFDVSTKTKVLSKLHTQLNGNGYLMLGAAETLIGVSDQFAPTPRSPSLFRPV